MGERLLKQILVISLITLLALGTACAWISPSSDATSEGIKVHGHWTVTVTNPDGSVDTVHEFDNEITNLGKDLLIHLLNDPNYTEADSGIGDGTKVIKSARYRIMNWYIHLYGQAGTTKAGIPGTQLNLNLDCAEEINEFSVPVINTDPHFVMLESDAQKNFSDTPHSAALHLTATCSVTKASNSSTITEIATAPKYRHEGYKQPTTGGSNHMNYVMTYGGKPFTKHVFQPSEYIQVENGQLLMFAVKISFS